MTIHRFTEFEAREFIAAQHIRYYDILRNQTVTMGFRVRPIPAIHIVDATFVACGQYNPVENRCTYSLPYAVYCGDEYRETVAHEVCHAFQRVVNRNDYAHGPTFFWLLRDVCKFRKAIATHSYPLVEVDRIAQELREMRGGISNNLSSLKTGLAAKLDQLNRLNRRT